MTNRVCIFLLVVLLGFWSPGNSSRALQEPGKNDQSINLSPEHALFIYQVQILWRFHVVCLPCTAHLSEPSSRSEAGIYIAGLVQFNRCLLNTYVLGAEEVSQHELLWYWAIFSHFYTPRLCISLGPTWITLTARVGSVTVQSIFSLPTKTVPGNRQTNLNLKTEPRSPEDKAAVRAPRVESAKKQRQIRQRELNPAEHVSDGGLDPS